MSTPSAPLSDWTIFVGAGISRNSGCPLFADFWRAFLDAALADVTLPNSRQTAQIVPNLARWMGVFPPEQLLYRLQKVGPRERDAVVTTLLSYLDGHSPNANHVMLAMMLAAGAQVWTTNYDTLIEDAAGAETCHAIARPDPPSCSCPKLHVMKPHGSFRAGGAGAQHFIFDSSAVLTMDPEWRDAFARTLAGRHVLVAGQRGLDADLMPVLMQAAKDEDGIRSGVWYESDVENRRVLKQKLPRFELPDCDDPSLAFQLHCSQLLRAPIPARLIVEPSEVRAVRFPSSHLATAIILDHFYPPAVVRRELATSVRADRPRLKITAARRLARSLLFDTRRLSQPVHALATPLLRLPLRSISERAWHLYLLAASTQVSAADGAEITHAVETGRIDGWSLPLRITAASSLKLTGPLCLIPRLIPAAELAEQEPSYHGYGVYTLLWASRNAGDLEAWQRLWDAESKSAALFDPNWAAWLQLEQADVASMRGDGQAALAALRAPETQFAAQIKRHPLFMTEYEMSLMQAEMLTGTRPISPEFAVNKLEALTKQGTHSELNTPYRRAALLIVAASLASLTGSRDEVLTWIKEAERQTPSDLHRVLIGVLRLRLRSQYPDRDTEVDPDQSLQESRRLCFGYGEALLLRELGRSDATAHLPGAQQLLSQWKTTPPLWIVP